MKLNDLFVDIACFKRKKDRENICGDAFLCKKMPDEGRVIAVLSDGLGSGVKANILAGMTASMAMRFTEEQIEPLKAAATMMRALPVCSERKISYATFSIIDVGPEGNIRLVEMGNPQASFFRGNKLMPLQGHNVRAPEWKDREIYIYQFKAEAGDRIFLMSDGVTQAGVGSEDMPLGWREEGCRTYLTERLRERPKESSCTLSEAVVNQAVQREANHRPGDDTTCAVIYLRRTKHLLLFTGPPFDAERDRECSKTLANFDGTRIICGGTTAEIVAREMNRKLTMNMEEIHLQLPPTSDMEGIDLVTEGIFTLTEAANLLEKKKETAPQNPATKLVNLFREHDDIEFLVGAKVNEAHQDPNLPIELEIRRNIIRRIAGILKKDYLKNVSIRFV